MKLAIITATAGADCAGGCIRSWAVSADDFFLMCGSNGMLPAYQEGLHKAAAFDFLAYIHDDVIIHEPGWQDRVLREFTDPEVGLVGFGGALGHGDPNLYKIPYDYHQLARSDYMSNVYDAEVHGTRFTGSRDVAVLDGYCLIVRREILEKAGGWPVGTLDYIAYDYWLCCMTRRLGYRIRVVGVRCHHLGGRTYVSKKIGEQPGAWDRYLDAHRYIYGEFSDVLPFRTERV